MIEPESHPIAPEASEAIVRSQEQSAELKVRFKSGWKVMVALSLLIAVALGSLISNIAVLNSQSDTKQSADAARDAGRSAERAATAAEAASTASIRASKSSDCSRAYYSLVIEAGRAASNAEANLLLALAVEAEDALLGREVDTSQFAQARRDLAVRQQEAEQATQRYFGLISLQATDPVAFDRACVDPPIAGD